MKKQVLFACAVALSLGSMSVMAAGVDQWYAGVSVGQAKNNFLTSYATSGMGYDNGSVSIDDTDTAFKLFGGYRLTRIWGVEFGFVDLGETSITGTFGGAPAADRLEASGLTVVGTATWQATNAFSVFGKAGIGLIKGEVTCIQACPGNDSASKTKVSPTAGGGVEYDLSKQFAVRAELDYFYGVKYHDAISDSRYLAFTAGGVFKF